MIINFISFHQVRVGIKMKKDKGLKGSLELASHVDFVFVRGRVREREALVIEDG